MVMLHEMKNGTEGSAQLQARKKVTIELNDETRHLYFSLITNLTTEQCGTRNNDLSFLLLRHEYLSLWV
jgi:hypothetical protein